MVPALILVLAVWCPTTTTTGPDRPRCPCDTTTTTASSTTTTSGPPLIIEPPHLIPPRTPTATSPTTTAAPTTTTTVTVIDSAVIERSPAGRLPVTGPANLLLPAGILTLLGGLFVAAGRKNGGV